MIESASTTKELLSKYQAVIGLEVHVQLLTKSKVFATEAFSFGSEANTHISPITIAHPGALPQINGAVVQLAIRMGLALGCKIAPKTYFARKNYFYPDLPKGYQISQAENPICEDGSIDLPMADGSTKHIEIERIHIEEDAGKSVHDLSDVSTMIDLNRAGAGLIEIVTRPDLRSAEEAARLMAEMRKLVRYLKVGDGNMERGNLRCDANISVMPKGSNTYGTRVEVKNMNSMTQLSRAINHEIERQVLLIESGGEVMQETRAWDVNQGITLAMRSKETADDYRYFPEPDLQPLSISQEEIDQTKATLPELPISRFSTYRNEYGFSFKDAMALVEQKANSDYFEALGKCLNDHKQAANWLMGPIKMYLNEQNLDISNFALAPEQMAEMIKLVIAGKVSHNAAKESLFPALLASPESKPMDLAHQLNIMMESKGDEVLQFAKQLLEEFPAETEKYRKGKKGLMGFFVGKVMRQFKGKANPKEVNKIMQSVLDGNN